MKPIYSAFRHAVGATFLAAAIAACGAGSAFAASNDLSGTLEKIKETGVVTVGFRIASIPFSYYNNEKQPIGYSIQYSKAIIDRLKEKLDMPDLQVRWLPITSQNRIPLTQNGTIDFECNSTTHNAPRSKQVSFSNSIFIISTRLMTRKDSGVDDFDDLKGKTVVVGAGTTSEILLRNMNVKKNMGMRIISAKDHTQSSLTLRTGRAVAMMMDDALLAGERAKLRSPKEWVITGTPQSYEVYGCMFRKGDEGIKNLIDHAVADMQTSGKAAAIYKDWFMSPIPPEGLNLDFPMSDAMKELFAHPNDTIPEGKPS